MVVSSMDWLSERVCLMRDSLEKRQISNNNIVSVLGSFDHRLSVLDSAMRPTQIRTHAVRKAHENIDRALKVAEVILLQFELSHQMEMKIPKGLHDDLEGYLAAIDQLRNIIHFLQAKRILGIQIVC